MREVQGQTEVKTDWNRMPEQHTVDRTIAALKERNFNPLLVLDRETALNTLQEMLPEECEVMTGASTTLEEIGFIEILSGEQHPWHNWKTRILHEEDKVKQYDLRRLSTTSQYFVGSVQAITEAGVVLGCDATGSRQGGYVYGARKVVWVVGLNKIVADLDSAFRRLWEHCMPLEDARIKRMGGSGTSVGKVVIYEKELIPDRITTILVAEALGY